MPHAAVIRATRLLREAQAMLKAASLDEFERGYVDAALWSTTDESDERGGNPLDDNYSVDDIAPETLKKMKYDCQKFRRKAGDLLDDIKDSQAGHDFWLTRNGHGTGFWDRDHPGDIGDKLTEIAERFGETWLHVGDDGQIYS